MGTGYKFHCEKCNYELRTLLGVGMRFPLIYKKAMEEARDGKLGEKIQAFLREHPDDSFDCSRVLAQCIYCGQYETVPDLTMYLPQENAPKEIPKRIWFTLSDASKYVSPMDLKRHYKVFAAYPHTCRHCGGDMKLFSKNYFERRNVSLKCPNCRSKLIQDGCICWD